jgi:hypothetical protein
MTGVPVLPAAPTEILEIALPKTFAPVPPEIAIPLTAGAVEIIPVKVIAENAFPVIECAPDPATEIPVILAGDVADDVSDKLLFEIPAAVVLLVADIPVSAPPAELTVTELPVMVAVEHLPEIIPTTAPVLVPLTEMVLLEIVLDPEVDPPNRFITVADDEPARLVKVMLLLEMLSAGSLGEAEV